MCPVSILQMSKNLISLNYYTQEMFSKFIWRVHNVEALMKFEAFWDRQFRIVLKILSRCCLGYHCTSQYHNIFHFQTNPSYVSTNEKDKKFAHSVQNTGSCPEVIWLAAKWTRVERVGEQCADAGAADIRPAGRSSEWKCQWMDCCFMRRRWLLYSLGPYQRKVCLIWPSCQKKRRRAGLQTAQRSPAPGSQTLTAASNNQTTPHTNLHFSFFHNLVHALLLNLLKSHFLIIILVEFCKF